MLKVIHKSILTVKCKQNFHGIKHNSIAFSSVILLPQELAVADILVVIMSIFVLTLSSQGLNLVFRCPFLVTPQKTYKLCLKPMFRLRNMKQKFQFKCVASRYVNHREIPISQIPTVTFFVYLFLAKELQKHPLYLSVPKPWDVRREELLCSPFIEQETKL